MPRSKGKLAKTDSIDAGIIAEFGRDIHPEIRPFADKETEEIKAFLVRRQQLQEMITAENNRLWSASFDGAALHSRALELAQAGIKGTG